MPESLTPEQVDELELDRAQMIVEESLGPVIVIDERTG